MDGTWIHSDGCPYRNVLWKHHGYTRKDWTCVYGCTPEETPSAYTHSYRCPFWDATGETPIGLGLTGAPKKVGVGAGRGPFVGRFDDYEEE